MTAKKKFEVEDNETIDMCLDRINQEGYMPVRRIEKPVFKEMKKDGKVIYEPVAQKIVFDTIKKP
ncbi:NETI motif-containing protein [Bacillus sp. 1P06AnD]|uniref:NETI motif-containing protein n=1 Tax=Bacillus sp. 1P06AnD TaxID=3132208 RepID=UPI00399F0952